MSGKFQPFLSILSGVLLSLAIANPIFPTGFAPASLVALVPLYLAIKSCRDYGQAMRCTALQALVVHLLSSYHLMFFRDFAVFTLGASALGTAGVASLFGALMYFPLKGEGGAATTPMGGFDTIFVQGSGAGSGKNHSTTGLIHIPYPLHFAMVYMLYDWYKAEGIGFLAYPWGTLPSAADGFPRLQQTADLCGVWGVSLMLALVSAVVGEAILVMPHCMVIEENEEPWGDHRYLSIANDKRRYDWVGSFLWDRRSFDLWCVARLCLVLILSASIYGTVQLGWVRSPVKMVTAVVVQQNSDPWVTDEAKNIMASERLTEEALNALEEEGRRADVVVWSEGVLNRAFPRGAKRYAAFPSEMPLEDFIRKAKVPFIIGGAAVEETSQAVSAPRDVAMARSEGEAPALTKQHHNAAILFDAHGDYLGYYGKLHLVPFAEVVPGVEYEWVRKFMKSVVGFSSGWAAGKRYTLFAIPAHIAPPAVEILSALRYTPAEGAQLQKLAGVRGIGLPASPEGEEGDSTPVMVSAPICFDDAFASVCRPLHRAGSEAFFNITDDSWSLTESAERQHLTVSRYRSIEYRTTMLRTTNSGVSAVIGPNGQVMESLPLFQEAARAVQVPIYAHATTPYVLLGDWLAMLCALLVAVGAMECAMATASCITKSTP